MPQEALISTPTQRRVVRALLERYPKTFAQELGIQLTNTPEPLFELLVAATLFSARIPHANAARAARALFDAGLTTARKMADATWQQRVDIITWHGYKRYDESTSSMLGESAHMVLERYRGDLRRLREQAAGKADQAQRLLMEFKGIGRVGADIFLREVQLVWHELIPYADARVLRAARRLNLGADAQALDRLVPRQRFSNLAAALIRVDLDHAYAELAAATSVE